MANKIAFPVFLILSILSATSFSQSPPPPPLPGDTTWVEGDDPPIFTYADEMPDDKLILEKIRANLRYSDNAKDAGTEGTVYVKFIIEADGRITNVKAQNEIDGIGGSDLVQAAEFAVRSLGRVKPAKQNGTPIRLERTIPIAFALSDDDDPIKLPDCMSLKEAKKTISWIHGALLDEYTGLCGSYHNSETRERFMVLAENLKIYTQLGGMCQHLSTSDQAKVNNYAIELLKNSALDELLKSGKIPCWE